MAEFRVLHESADFEQLRTGEKPAKLRSEVVRTVWRNLALAGGTDQAPWCWSKESGAIGPFSTSRRQKGCSFPGRCPAGSSGKSSAVSGVLQLHRYGVVSDMQ